MESRLLRYTEFQQFSTQRRLDALLWLRGRRDTGEIFADLTLLMGAANDAFAEDISPIILSDQFINMLYCWKECGQDEVLAKLTFMADVRYGG
jgi:hypothetical protein